MITLLVFCLFRIASSLRPKQFSFEKLLNDKGADVRFKDDETLRVLQGKAILAELHLNNKGVVETITTKSANGEFLEKKAVIAPFHQPFYSAVKLLNRKIYFTPAMAFHIASATLSLGEKEIRKEDMKRKMSAYFSGVDFLYS